MDTILHVVAPVGLYQEGVWLVLLVVEYEGQTLIDIKRCGQHGGILLRSSQELYHFHI